MLPSSGKEHTCRGGMELGRATLLAGCVVFAFSLPASATNTPCSGHKGGIAHCQGSTFICNDGSVSASKKNCAAYVSGSLSLTGASKRRCPRPAYRTSARAALASSVSVRGEGTTASLTAVRRATFATSLL